MKQNFLSKCAEFAALSTVFALTVAAYSSLVGGVPLPAVPLYGDILYDEDGPSDGLFDDNGDILYDDAGPSDGLFEDSMDVCDAASVMHDPLLCGCSITSCHDVSCAGYDAFMCGDDCNDICNPSCSNHNATQWGCMTSPCSDVSCAGYDPFM